ncbi:MAG: hypothetical protein RO009_15890 [Pseudorhodoplanes sp.]|jgi:hypothetical protein|nr:hypothetical protein [Pseudorhodoplanes sp.]
MKAIAFASSHGTAISGRAGRRKPSDLHHGTVPANDPRLAMIAPILSERRKECERAESKSLKNRPDTTTVKSGKRAGVRWQKLMAAIKFTSLRLVSKIRPSGPCCARYYSVFPADARFGTSHCASYSRQAASAWPDLPPLQASEVKGLFQHDSEPEDTGPKTPSSRTMTPLCER